MANTIPPHYSERHVQQRYSKALRIVQHSPASSFQPTREQKLQLYAFYKQVSVGNVNTPRPGLFDMVGRAKWDAWKKVKGINKLEAQYRYVDIFLQAVSEAYQKSTTKIQAQQILQAFTMKGTASDNDSTDEEITIPMTDGNHMNESSADEEEKAYLHEIQLNAGRSTPATAFRQAKSPAALVQSKDSRYRQPERSFLRPLSSASSTTLARTTSPLSARPFVHALPRDSLLFDDQLEERIDQNPWLAQQTTNRFSAQQTVDNQPIQGSTASSSVTVTSSRQRQDIQPTPTPSIRSQTSDNAHTAIVSLGPATKRALESLQAEVIALNDRIDDLRNELVRRQRSSPPQAVKPKGDGDKWDGWDWVIKAALKHAAINMLTALVLLLILYKQGNPAAYAVLTQLSKVWYKLRNRL